MEDGHPVKKIFCLKNKNEDINIYHFDQFKYKKNIIINNLYILNINIQNILKLIYNNLLNIKIFQIKIQLSKYNK